jgi:predicted TIM-barrel fold metal-dependent hydrolase
LSGALVSIDNAAHLRDDQDDDVPGIFANHAHVFPEAVNPDGTIDRLMRLLDDCAIASAVCFAPFAHQCDECGALGPEGFQPNDWLARELRSRPRLVGFGTVDLRRDDVTAQVRHIHDLGFRGIKIHPNAQASAILSPTALECYAAAEEMDLFISFHSGVHQSRLKDCRVLLFDEVAWRFPNLRFSLEHVGGYHFFNEALAVLFNHVPPPWKPGRCRLFAGLSSVFSPTKNRFWHLDRGRLLEIVAQIGAEQMIFGLDFPFNLEAETKLGIQTIRSLGLSRREVGLILGGNLRRELKLTPARRSR